MSKYLYGSNGSVWKKVRHIPREGEDRGILRYNLDGSCYRNEGGQTWKMTQKGTGKDGYWGRIGKWKK